MSSVRRPTRDAAIQFVKISNGPRALSNTRNYLPVANEPKCEMSVNSSWSFYLRGSWIFVKKVASTKRDDVAVPRPFYIVMKTLERATRSGFATGVTNGQRIYTVRYGEMGTKVWNVTATAENKNVRYVETNYTTKRVVSCGLRTSITGWMRENGLCSRNCFCYWRRMSDEKTGDFIDANNDSTSDCCSDV